MQSGVFAFVVINVDGDFVGEVQRSSVSGFHAFQVGPEDIVGVPGRNALGELAHVVGVDHMGEFAQRVPPGDADYILWADLKGVKTTDGTPLHLANEVTVHVYYDEREDTGLHLIK